MGRETNSFLKLLKFDDFGGMIGFRFRKTNVRIRHKLHRQQIWRDFLQVTGTGHVFAGFRALKTD